MGFKEGTKGFLLLDLDTKNVFASRNVPFEETIFPFASDSTSIVASDASFSQDPFSKTFFYDPWPMDHTNPTVTQPQEIVTVISADNTISSSANDGSIDNNIVSDTSDDDVLNNSANQPIWRSTHIRGPSSHLSDYHVYVVNGSDNRSSSTKYPISDSICYAKLSNIYQKNIKFGGLHFLYKSYELYL